MHPLLKRLNELGDIPPPLWERLEPEVQAISVQKGDMLLQAGEPCRYLYYIHEGLLRFYYLKDGQEFIRQFFFEKGFVTDSVSGMNEQPSRLNIDVLEPGTVYAVPFKVFQQTGGFYQEFMRQTLIAISNRMASIFLDTPEEKYLALLEGRPKVVQRIPQYMIASYIGVTPEGLSRIKRRIAKGKRS